MTIDARKHVRYAVCKGGDSVKTVNVTNARDNLYNLIDETIMSSEPIQIIGKRGNAILLSEDDWKAIQETLYLINIPGMKDSLIEGRNTPKEDLLDLEDIGWDID